ncbi:GerAB/ArcD/ProY family transporter [Paenibacillus rhizovicinus]|uniref:GerAB/ArcD/ProY family transporter n=1 Tax=Paenibacillus rhizovicinus TaxID=2704463 RepID=A0A6C0P4Y4_9BACL|nr:GerAB/ArcD/ProY family transporter [Paenibacillus rhizovicinus]QHW33604.1 GerAB/ArcD/ProY family transporter [Paenibacillus rhizovicinus]
MDRSWQVALTYFISNLGLIFFLYPGDIIACTEDGHWIPILLGFIVQIIVLHLYTTGLGYIGKKDIISLCLGIGKGMPFLILLPMAVYLLMVCIIAVRTLSEIMTIVFLSSTPLWAIMLLFLAISTYIAFQGITSILRTSVLLSFINVPVILFFFSASFQNVDWRYVFPLISDASFLTAPSFLTSFFVCAGGFLFLGFVQPYVAYRKKFIMIAALALLPFLVFSVYIPLMTFGKATASTFYFPFIISLDTISITWVMFDRITIFLLLSLTSFLMILMSISIWSTMRVVNQSFPFVKPLYLLLAIPLFVFIVCLAIPNWKDIEKIFWWSTYLRFYILLTVPLSTYFLGMRMKRRSSYGAID